MEQDLEKFKNNPQRTLTEVIDGIENRYTGKEISINGKNHPFVYLMDNIISGGHDTILRISDAISADYKVHARNFTDLSKHMADSDWDGILSEPSTTKLRYLIREDEIRSKAIRFEAFDNQLLNTYKKLVIPKDTCFKVLGMDFWLENGIEIRVMDYGGIQVLYDTSSVGPFNSLTTNYPEREFIELSGVKYLSIIIDVKQIAILEIPNKSSNDIVGFETVETYTDRLYKIRAFITYPSGTRQEMTVVMKRESYNPNYPTMVIDMYDNNQFKATIPPVYLQNGLGIGSVTLLVYTTIGELERDISMLTNEIHQVGYFNLDNANGQLNAYETPFKTIDGVIVTSLKSISGGLNGRTFEEAKNILIYGHRLRDKPISDIDLSQTFKSEGYRSIKSIDYPNYRLYRVTKPLITQENKKYDDGEIIANASTIGVYVGPILTSIKNLVDNQNATDNGERVTIKPGQVFDITEPSAFIISNLERTKILNSSSSSKIDLLTKKSMVSNPFYYVLDTTKDQANIRAYHFDSPVIEQQTFYYENPYLGIGLGIGENAINITNTGNGFQIDIVTTSSEEYKNIEDSKLGIQLAINVNETIRKSIKGILVGKNSEGERLWRFNLKTNFDVDEENQIYFKGFNQYGTSKENITSQLTETLNFIFTYEGDINFEKSNSDIKIDQSIFSSNCVAIIETSFKVQFGKHLNNLYTSVRPMLSSAQYKTYETDVMETYPENVYQYQNKELVIKDGKAVKLHNKGDVILDSKGKPTVKFGKGTFIKDENGDFIMKSNRELLYYWDFIGFDFNYYLTQDDYDIEYRNTVREKIVNDILERLTVLTKDSLEVTKFMFKPLSTMGYTNVIINDSMEGQIKNDFSFSVTYYLTKEGDNNNALKETLKTNTRKYINEAVLTNTLSTSDLIDILRPENEENVVGVVVKTFNGDTDIDVVSNIDDTNGFGVKKKITLTGDNFLTVREEIDINFKRHRNK